MKKITTSNQSITSNRINGKVRTKNRKNKRSQNNRLRRKIDKYKN